MSDIRSKINQIYSLEQLAWGSTVIHRLHPMAKLFAALIYIVAIVSLDRYGLTQLVPFVFYPAVIMSLGEIPCTMIFKRAAVALPFCLFAGISNVIFDRETMTFLGNVAVSYGFVSCLTIIMRTILCVSAVLILVAATPFQQLCGQLRRLRVPQILIMLFEMTYRYVGVLAGEAASMYTAYNLRSGQAKGLKMSHMGSFLGQLFIRSTDRAEKIYGAMKCRGYGAALKKPEKIPFKASDWVFLGLVSGLCLLFRFVNVPQLIGGIFGGMI